MFFRQLRSELWKLFGKKRTYIGFGVFLVAQFAMLLLFDYSQRRGGGMTRRLLEGNGYLAEQYLSALTVAFTMLLPQVMVLMPLYTCLVGGDMVAKEAEDGTLRMILSRPITRFRLLFVKWLAGVVFCVALVVALGTMAVLLARIWFPWSGMFVIVPDPTRVFAVMEPWDGLARLAMAHVILAINASTMFTLAFMFSCFNMKPAAATILGVSFLLVSFVMDLLPQLAEFRDFFIVQHFRCWLHVFSHPISWPEILKGLSVIAGFNIAAFIVGLSGFHVRDIKS